jgi:sec-independent protein translocase protein TatA
MAFGLGGPEIVVIILIIVILFFGAKKIPELAKGLGRAMGEFKRGKSEVEREMQQSAASTPAAGAPVAKQPKAAVDTRDPKLVKAAQALGIDTEGKTEAQLREEIAKATKNNP